MFNNLDALTRRYYTLETTAKAIKDEMDTVKDSIVHSLLAENLDEYITNSGECVKKIDADLVSFKDTQAVIKLLMDNGYTDFVVKSLSKGLTDEVRNNTEVGNLVKRYADIKTIHKLSVKLVS